MGAAYSSLGRTKVLYGTYDVDVQISVDMRKL